MQRWVWKCRLGPTALADPWFSPKGRSTVPAFLWGLLLIFGLGWGTDSAALDLKPELWGGSVAAGWDARPLGNNDFLDPVAGTGDGRYWFARHDDTKGFLELHAGWKMRSFYKRAKLKLKYEQNRWFHGEILNTETFAVDFRQRLPGKNQIGFVVDYSPQVYSRHRADKDALPGDLRFRPEAYAETEAELSLSHSWSGGYSAALYGLIGRRDETRWFRERNRNSRGAGLGLALRLIPGLKLAPGFEYEVTRSKNRPDLGSDISYRQHVAILKVGWRIPPAVGDFKIDLSTKWKFRRYTTGDSTDTRRFGRHDTIYYYSARISKSLGPFAPYLSLLGNGRSVNIPLTDSSLEDNESDRKLVQLGLDWEFKL